MLNNNTDNKLDETIKKTLTNYETFFDIAGWNKMQNILDAAPKSTPFNWKYPIYFIVAISVLTTGYFIYNSFSAKNTVNIDTKTPAETNTPSSKTIRNTPQGINNPAIIAPTHADSIKTNAPVNNNGTFVTPSAQTINNSRNTLPSSEKTKSKKEIIQPPAEEFNGNQRMSENPTVFGGSDTTKNAEAKEAEDATKRKKITTPVGWNSLLINVNPDSIRKTASE